MGACLNQLMENESKESLAEMAEGLIGEIRVLRDQLRAATETTNQLSKSWDILKAVCDEHEATISQLTAALGSINEQQNNATDVRIAQAALANILLLVNQHCNN